jgi:hypothetical protein
MVADRIRGIEQFLRDFLNILVIRLRLKYRVEDIIRDNGVLGFIHFRDGVQFA